ncbi:MAG: F0F1 ATP synthase subunit B [Chloroflexota bacterium]
MGGIGELGLNWPTLLAQVVNVGILFVLLYFAAYKPVTRMLDERSRRVKESMENAEAIKQQLTHTEETVKKQIETASREGQERINRAVAVGEEIKVKSREEAKQEAETLIDRARSEIQHERDEAIQGVRKEFVDLTIMAAEKIIERSLDKEAHRELIEKVLEGEIKED